MTNLSRILVRPSLVLVAALPVGGIGHFQAAQQVDLQLTALNYASQLHNVNGEQLALVNSAWLGQELYQAKVLDRATGEIHLISLHSSGNPATDQEVQVLTAQEQERGFVGKIELSLKQKADADISGVSTVCIWVRAPEAPRQRWRSLLEAGERVQILSEARAFHQKAEASVLEFLRDRSITVKYADDYVPVITVEVSNAMLQELESLPQVGRIFDNPAGMPALAQSIPTIKAQKVWNAGFMGANVKVAVVELLRHPT